MKYASVYLRGARFKMSYWCPRRQKRVHEITPFSKDDPQGRRKALDLAYARSKDAAADREVGGGDRWERWVDEFLAGKYAGRDKTLTRMTGAWRQWARFLGEEAIRVPRALDYNAVLAFIRWRTGQIKPSGRRVSKNTALCDVRVMSVLLREAIRRGWATVNHCEKLGITKDPAKVKREMTDAEVAKIRAALAGRPEWMRVSFEIALHQGCRLTETEMPMSAVDLERGTMTFSAKGRRGEKHVFTTQLHPALRPMLQALQAKGAAVTCTLPQMAAKEWHFFLKDIGLGHLCFHCTRVTVITRMARAGVPLPQAMAYVGHASETIHRIYQKLAAGDLDRAVAALQF